MRVKSLKVINFYDKDSAEYSFEPEYPNEPRGIILVKGGTGSGKTAVAEGLAIALSRLFTVLRPSNVLQVSNIKSHIDKEKYFEEVREKYSRIQAEICFSEKLDPTVLVAVNKEHASEEKKNESIAEKFNWTIGNDLAANLPLIRYYPSPLRIVPLDESVYIPGIQDRREAYYDIFGENISLSKLRQRLFCFYWYQYANKKDPMELELFSYYVNKFLAIMDEGNPSIKMDVFSLNYYKGNAPFLFKNLSSTRMAYSSIIFDLAIRASYLMPRLLVDNKPDELTGVVIIDDLDKLLPEKYFFRFLEAVDKTFPNVQFIITSNHFVNNASFRNYTSLMI